MDQHRDHDHEAGECQLDQHGFIVVYAFLGSSNDRQQSERQIKREGPPDGGWGERIRRTLIT